MAVEKFKASEFFKGHQITIQSVLDIGAHQGKWTTDFREVYPNARFVMVEANDEHRGALERVGNYRIALVGKYHSVVDYYVCEDKNNNHGNGMYKENTNVPFTVVKKEVTTLERLFPDQIFDLIKMDVQGAELDIIQGSPGMIHQTKFLWLELQPHHYNVGAPSAGKVIGYLHEIGFEMVAIDEINIGNGVIMGMDIIFMNTGNKDLKIEYDIDSKVIWGGYPT